MVLVAQAEREDSVLCHVYVGESHRKAREEAGESLRAIGRKAGLEGSERTLDSWVDVVEVVWRCASCSVCYEYVSVRRRCYRVTHEGHRGTTYPCTYLDPEIHGSLHSPTRTRMVTFSTALLNYWC